VREVIQKIVEKEKMGSKGRKMKNGESIVTIQLFLMDDDK
jgi:hypothetical protein